MSEKTVRRRLFELLEPGVVDDPASQWVDRLLMLLIALSILALVLSTVGSLAARYLVVFQIIELIAVSIFSIEYLLRLWTAPEAYPTAERHPIMGRLRFALRPLLVIDFLAILPTLLAVLGLAFGSQLLLLRTFRLLRLLKLVRYSPALVSLGRVLRTESRALMAAGVVTAGLILLSAAVMYYLEGAAQPDVFSSIPASMWWAVVTLTTVGYGDVTPITDLGKVVGGIIMIFGLAMYALPIGIIASGFEHEIRQRDFVVSWNTLTRVPIFADLDVVSLSNIARLLHAREFKPGEMITHRGKLADTMYFIVSGHVEIRHHGLVRELGPGHFFGEVSLLEHGNYFGTSRATLRSQLMLLHREDFAFLTNEYPAVRHAIMDRLHERLQVLEDEPDSLDEEERDFLTRFRDQSRKGKGGLLEE